jgi:DNA polymerase (family 10)
MKMTNIEIAELLRRVAAAYEILGENRFRIIAYERAADSIEHLTGELKDYWREKKLNDIPGVGDMLASHLDELFRTGHAKHFDAVMAKLPASIFPLLLVPGIGPKKAYKLVTELKLKSEKTVIEDLEKAVKAHKIVPMEGFGEKSEEQIRTNIEIFRRGQIKENRMALPLADEIAADIIAFLKKDPGVVHIDVLGSLRRKVSTIGDIDIAVATLKPKDVIAHFLTYPHQELIEEGPTGSSVRLHNGRQVDLRVQKPALYGAMLQYFTGSKNHNIALRSFALSRGLSLNEYGIKHVTSGKVDAYASEEKFYNAIGLSYIPPELREDHGEILAAQKGTLPKLVELADIKGDMHIHTSYDLEPSHDLGTSPFSDYLKKAESLGYEYIGISDHNPSVTNHTVSQIVDIMKKRKSYYESHNHSKIHHILMCEVDILPDGKLALPDAAFEFVDGVIVSLHSVFTQDRKTMTKRIISALTAHPKVRIYGHPTGRLLGKREGVDADWKEIFSVCRQHDIALEIDAASIRLDLPDTLVYEAVKEKIRFCIDSDSHQVEGMNNMKYGISVARRGWATKREILNTLEYNEFIKWFSKS